MAYTFKHRNRAQGADQIELFKAGTDNGTAVSCSLATGAGYDLVCEVPYNAWHVGGAFWTISNTGNVTLKVKPYVNHQQTILGGAMYMTVLGTTNVVTVITNTATGTGGRGSVFMLIPGGVGGAVKVNSTDLLMTPHGFKVIITAANTVGNFDVEMLCVPGA